MVEVLKVSSKSSPNAVAGALAAVVRQKGGGEIQVVGAGALNQAVKAIAIARGYLETSGIDLVCVPTFADIEIGGEQRTAIRLFCQDRAGVLGASHDVDLRTVAAVAASGVVAPVAASGLVAPGAASGVVAPVAASGVVAPRP